MRIRIDILEKFTSFINFENGDYNAWATDSKLKNNLQSILDENQKIIFDSIPFGLIHFFCVTVELKGYSFSLMKYTIFKMVCYHKKFTENLIEYFYEQHCQNDTLATKHLEAFMQESCYWAALKISETYNEYFPGNSNSIDDYFNQAITLNVGDNNENLILSLYNSSHKNKKLAAFAQHVFYTKLIDFYRKENRTFGHSKWILLLHTSETRIKQALKQYGVNDPNPIDSYLLVWKVFFQKYEGYYNNYRNNTRSIKKLPEPDDETRKKVLQEYRIQRNNTDFEIEDWQYLDKILDEIVKAIRQHQPPPKTLPNFDEEDKEYYTSILIEKFEECKDKEVLEKYYSQNKSTIKLGREYSVHSSTVGRWINKSKNELVDFLWEHIKKKNDEADDEATSKQREHLIKIIISWIYTHFTNN